MLQKWMGHADMKLTAIYATAIGSGRTGNSREDVELTQIPNLCLAGVQFGEMLPPHAWRYISLRKPKGILNPFEDSHAGELGAVVRHNCLRHSPFSEDAVQFFPLIGVRPNKGTKPTTVPRALI